MVGLGETNEEVADTLRDLRDHGVEIVTIGQYLQPTPRHAPIDRWVHPDEFHSFRDLGRELGFRSVFSAPLVRSSYRADEQQSARRSSGENRRTVERWFRRTLGSKDYACRSRSKSVFSTRSSSARPWARGALRSATAE